MSAQAYIRRIRNAAKRDYATRYWAWLSRAGPHPDEPEELSYMAAQAVRLQLHEHAARNAETRGRE